MANYRIIVTRYDDGRPTGETRITCATNYTLLDDLAEWVEEEIDSQADVTHIPEEALNVENGEGQDTDNEG